MKRMIHIMNLMIKNTINMVKTDDKMVKRTIKMMK